MPTWFFIICQFSIIACAVVGGVFLTFSDFVMRSLNSANTASGIEVMQVINREVYRYVFMTLFLGLSAFSLFVIFYAGITLSGSTAVLVIMAGAIYLVGVFGVTVLFNVPMNNMLATLDYSTLEAVSYWKNTYLPDWTFWNSVRTMACVASAVCYLVAGIIHGL